MSNGYINKDVSSTSPDGRYRLYCTEINEVSMINYQGICAILGPNEMTLRIPGFSATYGKLKWSPNSDYLLMQIHQGYLLFNLPQQTFAVIVFKYTVSLNITDSYVYDENINPDTPETSKFIATPKRETKFSDMIFYPKEELENRFIFLKEERDRQPPLADYQLLREPEPPITYAPVTIARQWKITRPDNSNTDT